MRPVPLRDLKLEKRTEGEAPAGGRLQFDEGCCPGVMGARLEGRSTVFLGVHPEGGVNYDEAIR